MQTIFQKAAELLSLNKLTRRWQKVARVLAIVVVFCTTYMLILPAITMERETLCGIENHIHIEECYISSSVKDGPDCETPEQWEKAIKEIAFTQSSAENVLSVARTQLGYRESELNFITDENGQAHGYTRYGHWYGSPYGNWNAMFVSFCLNYSGMERVDLFASSGASGMRYQWSSQWLYEAEDIHKVKEGEIVFFDTDGDEQADYAGIVSGITEEGKVKAILGDIENQVKEITVEDESVILGYGLTDVVPVKTTEEETTKETSEEESTTQAEAEETTTEEETTQKTTTTEITTTEETASEVTTTQAETTQEVTTTKEVTTTEVTTTQKPEAQLEGQEDIENLTDEQKERVEDACAVIDELPSVDEFYGEIDAFYEKDDTEGEENYIREIQKKTEGAVCVYQQLGELKKYVRNSDKLTDLLDIFSNMPQMYTVGTSEAIVFNYVNTGWVSSDVAPVVIYGGNATEKITTNYKPSEYWNGVVVEYDDFAQQYYVSEIYISEGENPLGATKIQALEATTSKGFVLFVWSANSGATAENIAHRNVVLNAEVGDIVEVSTAPTSLSAGHKTAGYGTIKFKQATETVEDLDWYSSEADPSDVQIRDGGGKVTSADKRVVTTKTIDGTEEENVFDITLTVETQEEVQTFLSEPDMAVVIVMDISNTMDNSLGYNSQQTGIPTRYAEAISAATSFIESFEENTSGISTLGFVAFNTDAHKIFDLQPCGSNAQEEMLINEMSVETKAIMDAYYPKKDTNEYYYNHRFTNIEGGLKMAHDMLEKSGNKNKYVLFLSDGFPTTYLNRTVTNSDDFYEGYSPNCSSGNANTDGVFCDTVTKDASGNIRHCDYGTSYSDKAAVRAREIATTIKQSGTKIFSIGIDVGMQTVQQYLDQTTTVSGLKSFSVVDRRSTTYEIGDAKSKESYKTWLGSSIGSNNDDDDTEYYYDSTNHEAMVTAFETVFSEIKQINSQSTGTIWTATDPMPILDEEPSVVGFVHFYDKDGNIVEAPDNPESITGEHKENAENTAYHDDHTVHWDLKKSGYEKTGNGDVYTYKYALKYRVRLVNEKKGEKEAFVDGESYYTNGDAYLSYRNVKLTSTSDNGVLEEIASPLKSVSFSKPAVEGYLSDFTFNKVTDAGQALPGAVFSLSHDDENCQKCHGDGTAITDNDTHNEMYQDTDGDGIIHAAHIIGPYTATSDKNGKVSFSDIPSGHKYVLKETTTPQGYIENKNTYGVFIEYDEVSFSEDWDGKTVTNVTVGHLLPETGGRGIYYLYIIGGLLITLSAVFLLCLYKDNRQRRRRNSS